MEDTYSALSSRAGKRLTGRMPSGQRPAGTSTRRQEWGGSRAQSPLTIGHRSRSAKRRPVPYPASRLLPALKHYNDGFSGHQDEKAKDPCRTQSRGVDRESAALSLYPTRPDLVQETGVAG